jgi:methionyl-tRNA formyltransferase
MGQQTVAQMIGTDHDICYVSCTEGGYEVLRNLLTSDVHISGVVSLTHKQADEYDVAGYYPMGDLTDAYDIPIYFPDTYKMDQPQEIAYFRDRSYDLMIVNGWQRLIRDQILDTVSIGALGVHGSASGLPKGRGRSPMNWSLVKDLDRFLLSVIQLDPGVDSGAIVDTRKYDITEFDTIRTLYYKLAIATTEILLDSLPSILNETFEYTPQSGEETFYPERTPDDGAIHWHDSTRDIYNLVRAVADPYPGAFTKVDNERVLIWDAVPFSADFGIDSQEGTILQVFETTGDFVVRTGDGTLLVTEWEAETFSPDERTRFDSIGDNNRADTATYD